MDQSAHGRLASRRQPLVPPDPQRQGAEGRREAVPAGRHDFAAECLRDAVRDGKPAETRGEDNIWTVAMVEAGKLADRERRTVELAEVYPSPIPDPAAR